MESTDVFRLAGTTLEGRFIVDRVVAEGGFGVVYYAQQAALERPVALKVLKTPQRFDETAKRQFLAGFASEAKTIARITHSNIVLVYDFGVSDMPSGERAAWMALEWLTGVALDEELARRRGQAGMSPRECLSLMRPALSALAVVHAAGVAHRDLKPANIMLVRGPAGTTTPKLLDFGIAKIMGEDEEPGAGHTRTGAAQIAFSPLYGSPEQISQGRSGPWTDVHAMGLILTEMLTNRPPLGAETAGVVYQQIVHPVRPSPAKFGVAVGAWEDVLLRALAVAPIERYRDASELLGALENTVDEASRAHVIVAPPPGSGSGAPLAAGLESTQIALVDVNKKRDVTTTPQTHHTADIQPAPRPAGPSRSLAYVVGAAVTAAVGAGGLYAVRAARPDVPYSGLVQSVGEAKASAAPAVTASVAQASPPEVPAPAVLSAATATTEPDPPRHARVTRGRLPATQQEPPVRAASTPSAIASASPPAASAAPAVPSATAPAPQKLDSADPWGGGATGPAKR